MYYSKLININFSHELFSLESGRDMPDFLSGQGVKLHDLHPTFPLPNLP